LNPSGVTKDEKVSRQLAFSYFRKFKTEEEGSRIVEEKIPPGNTKKENSVEIKQSFL
jgi:hypothetical protein